VTGGFYPHQDFMNPAVTRVGIALIEMTTSARTREVTPFFAVVIARREQVLFHSFQ
jgi:hypothetical protein